MKCFEFTTFESSCIYNFKNLAVGLSIRATGSGVLNSSSLSLKFTTRALFREDSLIFRSTAVDLVHIETLGKPRRLGPIVGSVNKNKYKYSSFISVVRF